MRLGEMREASPARHCRGDRNKLLVALRKFRQCLTDNLGIGWRWRRRGLASLQFVFAKPMKFVRLFNGGLVAFAFLRENVEENRFLLGFQKLKCPDQQRDIVPINRTVVAQAQLLEDNARDNQPLYAFFDLMREFDRRFAGNRSDEIARFVVQMGKRWAGRDAV